MFNILKKLLVVLTLSLFGFVTVQAMQMDTSTNEYDFENYEYIEDAKLASSRFTKPDDLSLVDSEYIIEIDDRDDVLIASNSSFELYFNEEFISFKIKDLATNYVWATAIDSPSEGSYTSLLESGIGIEYILIEKDMALEENVGISDIAFTLEQTPQIDGIDLSLDLGGYCATRNCKRNYDRYLDDDLTLEQMIAMGYTEINVAFDMSVKLTDTGISVNIPNDSIEDKDATNIVLSSIILFPGLGATEMDQIPGYMMIPDGAGALIRYEDNEGQFKAPFEEAFFGDNLGLQEFRTTVTNYPLSMPIFGAVHGVNQNAFLGIIEEGQFNSRLFAYPNGAHNLTQNLIFPKFDFKQVYRQSFSSDGTGGALKYINTSYEDVSVKYNFINGADASYVGMAKNYQEHLVSLGDLEMQTKSGDIEIFLNYLMSDSESSFFGSSLIEMSTVKQVMEMYDYFMNEGVSNQSVGLMGWNDGGFTGYLPSKVDYENKLGSNRSFRNLLDYINQNNSVMLENNYLVASEGTKGISYRNDVAKGTNKFKIEGNCLDCVYAERYLLYPNVSKELALKDFDDYTDDDAQVLFESLASNLMSYYDSGTHYTRTDAYNEFVEVMEAYDGIGNYYYPNSYAYKYTDSFYEAPLYNSQLKYYDDAVPFLQIVLKGYIDLYASYLNFNSLGNETLLNLIDFGMNPAFVLTYEPASQLKDTDLRGFFTTEFDLWKETIVDEYAYINNALKHVNGEAIVNRVVLDYGIVKISYTNNVDIFINYTTSDYTVGPITIPSKDYYVGGVS